MGTRLYRLLLSLYARLAPQRSTRGWVRTGRRNEPIAKEASDHFPLLTEISDAPGQG